MAAPIKKVEVFPYPNDDKYRGGAGFDLRCVALGRNGTINATGVEVYATEKVVTLTPITTRGVPGRCYIELPNDPAFLRALAEKAIQVADGATLAETPLTA